MEMPIGIVPVSIVAKDDKLLTSSQWLALRTELRAPGSQAQSACAGRQGRADSSGERNELGELLQWCHVTECLARTAVEAPLKAGQIGGAVL